MGPLDAFDAIVGGAGASPVHAERVMEMRLLFVKRSGSFGPEDPWFETRSRAFWDDAVTTQGFARLVSGELDHGVREWVGPLSCAHRGLFEASKLEGGGWMLRDLWGGAEFIVEHAGVGMRDALDAATSPLDARIIARASSPTLDVAILPGAVFHPEDAGPPMLKVIEAARARNLGTEHVLDALLRMERNLRALSRVKASYAYREGAL